MRFSALSVHDGVRVLQDRAESGRERPWRQHKEQSLELANSFARIGDAKAQRVRMCGGYLKFAECPSGHEKRLIEAYFCQVRLCPMCAWRRSLKIFAQLNKVIHVACQRQKMRFIFLTLTCRNVHSEDLSEMLDKLFAAWQRLSQRKVFRENVLGWFRALEVTHRMDRDEYHPHFHVLLAVRPSYFGQNYLKQAEWAELWRQALRVNYTPITDVRAVRPKRKGQTVEAAVAEVGKYAVKPDDYIDPDDQLGTDYAVETLDKALKNRRLVAYGGIFKEIRRELRMEDVEKADLVKIDEDEPETCTCDVCRSELMSVVYRWHIGLRNYVAEEDQK